MKLTRLSLLMFLIVALLPMGFSAAQDGGDDETTLAYIINAYGTTASVDGYRIEWDEETDYELTLSQDNNTLLVESSLEISKEATSHMGNIEAVLEYTSDQAQTLNDDEPMAGEVELNVAAIVADGQTYINFDETATEYRVGLPEGWQLVTDELLLPNEAQLSSAELTALVSDVLLPTADMMAWLNGNVLAIEELGEDEKEGYAVRGYLLTLDFAGMLTAQGVDVASLLGEDALLPAAVIKSIENNTVYTLEVWITTDTNFVVEHIITWEYAGSFAAGTFDGDLAEATLTLELTQEQTLTLSDFAGEFDITAPELAAEDDETAESE